jgi:hypothetical protein
MLGNKAQALEKNLKGLGYPVKTLKPSIPHPHSSRPWQGVLL